MSLQQSHPDYDDDEEVSDWNPETYYSDVEEASRLVPNQSLVRKQNKINFLLCAIALFLSNVGFSIVSPSLWNYIKHVDGNIMFLGAVVALYSTGQVLGAPVLNNWANRRKHKEPLLFSLFLIIVGGCLYGASFNLWLILASRVIQGFGAGNTAIIQSYVASTTEQEQRSSAMATLNLVGTLGYAFGPLIGAAFSFLHVETGPLKLFPYSTPGYVSAIMGLIALGIILIFFKEPLQHRRLVIDQNGSLSIITPSDASMPSPLKAILLTLIVIYFNVSSALAAFDTLATPITVDHYDWGVFENCLLWGCISIVALLSYLSINLKYKYKITDGIFIACYTLLQLVGFVLMLQWPSAPLWRFLSGTAFFSWGFPVTQVLVVSTFSKLLGDQKQGPWMGALTATAAAARVAAPLWSAMVYETTNMCVISSILAGLMVITFGASLILFAGGFVRKQLEKNKYQKMTGRRT